MIFINTKEVLKHMSCGCIIEQISNNILTELGIRTGYYTSINIINKLIKHNTIKLKKYKTIYENIYVYVLLTPKEVLTLMLIK